MTWGVNAALSACGRASQWGEARQTVQRVDRNWGQCFRKMKVIFVEKNDFTPSFSPPFETALRLQIETKGKLQALFFHSFPSSFIFFSSSSALGPELALHGANAYAAAFLDQLPVLMRPVKFLWIWSFKKFETFWNCGESWKDWNILKGFTRDFFAA